MKAEAIEGFMAVEELAALRRKASQAEVVVEVGSWKGRSTAALAEGLPPGGVVYAVEHFRGCPHDLQQCPAVREAAVNGEGVRARAAFLTNLHDHLDAGRVRLLELPSAAAANLSAFTAAPPFIDLLFLDGSHDAPSLTADLDAWLPHLRPGGVLLLHDRDYASVRQAVTSYPLAPLEELEGVLWKWAKP